jgi:hypothetical protein
MGWDGAAWDGAIEVAATGQQLLIRVSSPESVVYESLLPARQPGLVAAAGGGQEQRFEVLEGTLIFCIDGAETLLTAGGRLRVPRGTTCTYWNPGTAVSHLVAEVRPALQFEEYVQTRKGERP